MPIIKANNLVKTYKDPKDSNKYLKAVDGISLSINAGEIYGILGPNGAGKTTTLEMLEGLKDIDDGTAFINSINVSINPYQVKQVIGVQLQANEYFDNMSLSELLNLFSALYSSSNDPMELLNKVNLGDKANAKANELSGGQKQKVAISRALLNSPDLIIADEPTGNLDPKTSLEIMNLLLELNKKGNTILMATHDFMMIKKYPHKTLLCNNKSINEIDITGMSIENIYE